MLNELPNRALVLKIADFGYSCFFKPDETMQARVGSPIYMAPEMLVEHPKYSSNVDVWSAGVTMFMLLAGDSPYYADDQESLLRLILNTPWVLPSTVRISPPGVEVLAGMLELL